MRKTQILILLWVINKSQFIKLTFLRRDAMINNTITTIRNRRSIRIYDEKQIKDEELNLIIESGRYEIANQHVFS